MRKRCYEPTESPRSPETARARLNSCRAYVAARGARSQVISGVRSWWRNRLHGAYRGARKVAGGGVCVHMDAFFTRTCQQKEQSSVRDGAAPESRRLAEFGTERPGLSQKFRSYRRFCACGKSVEKGAGDKALKVAQTQSRRCPCQAPSCMQGDYEKDLTGNFLIIMERLARA